MTLVSIFLMIGGGGGGFIYVEHVTEALDKSGYSERIEAHDMKWFGKIEFTYLHTSQEINSINVTSISNLLKMKYFEWNEHNTTNPNDLNVSILIKNSNGKCISVPENSERNGAQIFGRHWNASEQTKNWKCIDDEHHFLYSCHNALMIFIVVIVLT